MNRKHSTHILIIYTRLICTFILVTQGGITFNQQSEATHHLKEAKREIAGQNAAAKRRAIVSSLYDDSYALPLRVLAYSLRQVKVQADMVLIYIPQQVNQKSLCQVKNAGWKLMPVERIEPPHQGTADQFRDQYTKMHVFNLTKYEEIIYVDADTLALNNFDELWGLPTKFAAVRFCVWQSKRIKVTDNHVFLRSQTST